MSAIQQQQQINKNVKRKQSDREMDIGLDI